MTQPNAFLVGPDGFPTKNGVYIAPDGSITFITYNSNGQQVQSAGLAGAVIAIPRSAGQLSGTPSAADVSLGAVAQFYNPAQVIDSTHPWVYYTATVSAYVAISSGGGGGGGSFASLTGQPNDNPALALALGKLFPIPLPWHPASNTQIVAGTPNASGASYVAQETAALPGGTAVDNVVSPVLKGTVAYFDGTLWQQELPLPSTTSVLIGDGNGNALAGTAGKDFQPANVFQTGCPWGKPSSGTITTNGTLTTLATPFAVTYPNVWLRFPVGAVYAASPAGLYFTQMATVSTGTVFANYMLDDGTPTGPLTIPTTLTPLSGTTGSAYTQDVSNTYSFTPTVTLPAHSVGNNGEYEAMIMADTNGGTGAKQINIFFGSGAFITGSVITTATTVLQTGDMMNQGTETLQVGVNSNGTRITASVDTGSAQTMKAGLRTTVNATDYCIVTGARVRINPRA